MKKLFGIVILPLLVACSGENPEDQEDAAKEEVIESEITTEEEDAWEAEFIASESMSKEIFLEDIPLKWLKLTDADDISINTGEEIEEWAIYYWCYAELPQLWFEPEKGENWTLIALYGQDSEQWYIENFKASETEKELYMVVDGTFDLVPINPNFGEKKSVTFWWNRDISFASFTGIYDQETFFTPEEGRGNYQEITEECDDEP